MLNGVLTFFGGQGDRLVIADRLPVTQLGLYSAVTLLAYYPMGLASRLLLGIQMPIVARAHQNPATEGPVLDAVGGDMTLMSVGAAVGFFIVTPSVLVPLFGARFAQSTMVIALVGLLQAWRFLRFWPTTLALGIGRSLPIMLSAIVRLVALPLSIAAMNLGYGLEGIIGSFIFGEVLACVVNLGLVNLALARGLLVDFERLGLMLGCGGAIVACAAATTPLQVSLAAGTMLAVAIAIFLRERRNLVRWASMGQDFMSRVRRTVSLRLRAS